MLSNEVMLQLLLGFNLAIIIAALAYALGALTLAGAVTASVLGFIVFGLGGLDWAMVLLAFFISSSILSRVAKKRKAQLEEKFSKGARRDAWQVLANGGIAGAMVLVHAFYPASPWPWIGFSASLAAANADTWATELGVLGPSLPRLITTGKPVERGTSGGLSLTGTLAGLAGALLVGLAAAFLFPGSAVIPVPGTANLEPAFVLTAARTFLFALAGIVGSLVDSLLGATVQAIFVCPDCKKETERYPYHSCGAPTLRVRGLPWLTNDWVNFACTLSGVMIAFAAFIVL
jgi:uncharacterized protein (TIGR00297 family)